MTRCTSIISAYFCEDWIHGRVTNLLEQTEVPAIVAVCQKGSKEDEILSKFPEVIRINTPDVPTVYACWNLALRCVQTDFVNIANSDDRLDVNAIKEMCDELEKDKAYGLAYSDCHVCSELNGEPIASFEWGEGDLLGGCFVGPSPVYRTELHKLYGEYPEEYVVAGDYWMWLNFQHNGVKFLHIKKKLCTFWDRSGNPSIVNNLEYAQSNRTIFESAKAREYWRKK